MSARPKDQEVPRFKKPMLGKCETCNHVWPVVWLPMEASNAARIMMVRGCPACGQMAKKKIVMASAADEIIWMSHHPSMKEEVRT